MTPRNICISGSFTLMNICTSRAIPVTSIANEIRMYAYSMLTPAYRSTERFDTICGLLLITQRLDYSFPCLFCPRASILRPERLIFNDKKTERYRCAVGTPSATLTSVNNASGVLRIRRDRHR
jgi:hypothetical protein